MRSDSILGYISSLVLYILEKSKALYTLSLRVIYKELKNMKTENELIKLGFEEADDIMCEDCGDAVATTLRGYGLGQKEVCSDCNCEMGF